MLNKLWPRTRKSHPISKLLRPLFEGKKPKKFFGGLLAALILLSGFFVPPASGLQAYEGKEELIALTAEVEVRTKNEFQAIFGDFKAVSISQNYWLFHKAIDLAAPHGTPMKAFLPGKIITARYEYGYGKTVVIDHGNNLQSRFAHLSWIEVKPGQEVTKETIIGRVGSTGRATGAHLHLEIQENGRYLNPKIFLSNLSGS